ncbi:universal stress protein, partial [Mycobacterium malmoense]|uniref:universal stress protein n=1 Tax=Mycobacterium malmoense TaxID=1780 RepID=UPI000A987FDF
MADSVITQSIVAGVDGSKAAIRAALWAVDEAVTRGVPLRLLHATDPADGEAAAELAVRHAVTAIRATGKPVRVETEIAPGPAVGSLIRSSASAAMVCVGAVGLR